MMESEATMEMTSDVAQPVLLKAPSWREKKIAELGKEVFFKDTARKRQSEETPWTY